MGRYILKRLGQAVVIILIITIFTFSLTYLTPGDPVYAVLGSDITQEQYDMQYIKMGLDKPLIVRYLLWLGGLFRGDFGDSFKYHQPVAELIAQRLPVTLYLGLLSIVIGTILGILFGVVCAVKRGKWIDNVITILANIGAVIPLFWLAVLGMYIFSMKLGWLPSYGFTLPWVDFSKSVQQTIMPLFALTLGSISMMCRQMRSGMLEVIRQDYMRTARAKGLAEREVILNHGLKNALIPAVTLMGISFKNAVAGSTSIEIIFNIAGMGQLLVNSITSKDIAVTQACILVIAIVVCLSNLLTDISYGYLDPRIRNLE